MAENKGSQNRLADLRRQAEERLRKHPPDQGDDTPEQTANLVHELQVHQIELEMQNEELRRAQEELEASRAKYFDLYDLAPVGYFTLSEPGLILEANLTATTMLGVPRSSLVKQPFTHFIYRDDQDTYYLHRKQLFETVAPQVCELRMVRRGGEPFWARMEATVASNGEGRRVCRVVMSDVSERKQADEALRETRDYLDNLLTYANTPIIVWSPDFRITRFNGAFERLTGLKTGDVLGRELDLLFPENRRAEIMARIRRTAVGERWEEVEIPVRCADGAVRTVLWNSATLYAADGTSAAATIAQGQDITERLEAEAQRDATLEQLQAALAEKEVLMREIYHRVKNNIQTLIYLMDMQTEFIADPDSRTMIHELQVRARTMSLVHEQLYQSGNLAQIDFGAYLNDLMANLSRAFWADRPIVWDIEAADALLGVDTAIPCGLIVNELLTNALKYAFPNARPVAERGETECKIHVEFRAAGDRFTLIVGDNGIGLPPGLDWKTAKSLGLQLIDILARHQLGGRIEVDSRAGTTFKITFTERKKK
jgi:PAS domain S-box-containing protein